MLESTINPLTRKRHWLLSVWQYDDLNCACKWNFSSFEHCFIFYWQNWHKKLGPCAADKRDDWNGKTVWNQDFFKPGNNQDCFIDCHMLIIEICDHVDSCLLIHMMWTVFTSSRCTTSKTPQNNNTKITPSTGSRQSLFQWTETHRRNGCNPQQAAGIKLLMKPV